MLIFALYKKTKSPCMEQQHTQLIIRGVTADGARFRPADWAERLCASVASFGTDGRIRRSPFVKIQLDGTEKRLIVDSRLGDHNVQGMAFLRGFANENNMQTETISGR